jgi:hypothetical protein
MYLREEPGRSQGPSSVRSSNLQCLEKELHLLQEAKENFKAATATQASMSRQFEVEMHFQQGAMGIYAIEKVPEELSESRGPSTDSREASRVQTRLEELKDKDDPSDSEDETIKL